MSKPLTPQLRFKGFDNEWVEKSLSESEFNIQAGGDVNKELLKPVGQYPVIANALIGEGILGYYDEYFRIKAPAISITGRGDVGVAVPRRRNFTPVVRLLALTSPNDIDFLANAINQHPKILESTGVPQLTVPKLQSYKIKFPLLKEQNKIGVFFRSIDNLIAEIGRELERLEKMKVASLQKMFPRPGRSTPEIRFKGFTDSWTNLHLKELCSYCSSNLTVKDASTKGAYPLYDANSHIGYVDTKRIQFPYISIIKDGAGVGRTRILPKDSFIIGTLGAIIPESSVNIYFLNELLNLLKLNTQNTGSTIPHIYFSVYGEYEVLAPSSAEQRAVGEYFRNLDALIAAKRQKLIKLRNIKASCLDKMFVNTSEL